MLQSRGVALRCCYGRVVRKQKYSLFLKKNEVQLLPLARTIIMSTRCDDFVQVVNETCRRKNYPLINRNMSTKSTLEQRTEDLLNQISEGTDGTFTLMDFDAAMEGWSKRLSPGSAEKAEQLLVALEKNYDDRCRSSSGKGKSHLVPNAISYNHVLHAYAQSNGGTKAVRTCEDILDRMLYRCKQVQDDRVQVSKTLLPPEPLVTTFNSAMNVWAKSKDSSSGMKAEQIFRKMERWNFDCVNNLVNKSYIGVKPTTRSLAIFVDAWANSKHEKTFERILAIFQHALDKVVDASTEVRYESGTSVIPLNTVFFNSVLNALANSDRGREAAEKAEEVFSTMEKLNDDGVLQMIVNNFAEESFDEAVNETRANSRTLSLLLKCWTNSVKNASKDDAEDAASRSEAILGLMEERYKAGQDTKPNDITYTSCIQAWAECSSALGAGRAMNVLERLEELHDTGDEELQPNTIHYNVCLSALCKVKDVKSLNRARDLLRKMVLMEIADIVSYNTLMGGYLNCNPANAYEHIEPLFDEMQTRNIVPDTITFNIMMDAVRKSNRQDAVDHVLKILHRMVDLSKSDEEFTPSTMSFTVALNAINASQIDEKVEPARKIFHEMLSLHEGRNDDQMKPDVRVFSAFISTCANQGGTPERKRAALKLALGTYEQLCQKPEYGMPNSFVYGSLLKAVGRLSSDQRERARLLEHIFKKCIQDGHLSRVNLNAFLRGATRQLETKLLGNLPEEKIPFEWYRNVKKHDRP